MKPAQREIMERLYGRDIWEGFLAGSANPGVQGWNGNHPALPRLLSGSFLHKRAIVVDVGVWKGQSTIAFAANMKRQMIDGCVIAVDTFLGSSEHWGGAELFHRVNGLPDLYRTFLNNVWHAGVIDYVVPLPQTTLIAAQILRNAGVLPHVVHIDASHEYEDALQDAEKYWELLAPGGYLVGDDYLEQWPGVVRAADDFSVKVGCPLVVEPPKWILQKPL
jgi:hypothetical protein